MENENWYILQTDAGKEYDGAALIERVIPDSLYTLCSIPRKVKPFRFRGVYRPVEDVMFPGYVFVRTAEAKKLHKELQKSREFPQFLVFGRNRMGEEELVPVSVQDLSFLQEVCGTKLQSAMGITDVTLGDNRQILDAKGALEHYVDRIVRLNIHRRFAVAEVSLFNRSQQIFFGIRLAEDKYCAV